jgi:hypothetical protein
VTKEHKDKWAREVFQGRKVTKGTLVRLEKEASGVIRVILNLLFRFKWSSIDFVIL